MQRFFFAILACAMLGVTGCNRYDNDRTAADAYAPAPTTNTPTTPAPAAPPSDTASTSGYADTGGITMRYNCDKGFAVAILSGDSARITLSDGRAIEIGRVAGSMPARYGGQTFTFAADSNGAMLSQDQVGEFACTVAD